MQLFLLASSMLVMLIGAENATDVCDEECGLGHLHGPYNWHYNGYVKNEDGHTVPFARAGTEMYDGEGNLVGFVTYVVDGEVIRNNERYNGTYEINELCAGVQYQDGNSETPVNNIYVARDGMTVNYIKTGVDGFTGTGQTYGAECKEDENGESLCDGVCSDEHLHGAYQWEYEGYLKVNDTTVPFARAGIEAFDGEGHIEGVITEIIDGHLVRDNQRYNGTYAVNELCQGQFFFHGYGEDDDVTNNVYVSHDGMSYNFIKIGVPGFTGTGRSHKADC